jgi:hypothetical protein
MDILHIAHRCHLLLHWSSPACLLCRGSRGVCYSFLDDNLPSRREVVQPCSYTSPAISAPCASTTRTRRPSQRCAAAASPSSSTWAAWTRSEPSPAAPLRRLPGLPGVGAPGGHTSRTAGATPPCAQAKLGAVQVRRPHGWPQLCASMRMAETGGALRWMDKITRVVKSFPCHLVFLPFLSIFFKWSALDGVTTWMCVRWMDNQWRIQELGYVFQYKCVGGLFVWNKLFPIFYSFLPCPSYSSSKFTSRLKE